MPHAVIESLDHEGRGISHVDGKAVFIEGALPGEKVEYAVLRERPRYVQAEVKRVLRASAQRVAPRCAHFGTCGGCSIQHLDPLAQTAATWHVLSHTRAEQSREDTPQGLHPERCDLCFSAATLFGGAPAGSAGPLPDRRSPGDALNLAPRGGHLSAPLRAYDSRAPPFSTL